MKTLLILYPHWHPVNLAGVHRPRLVANFLHELGWNTHVLTVKEAYFEEKPDPDLHRIFSDKIKVTRVKAMKVTKPRIIGDIGLRAFFPLVRKAREIIQTENPDFLWIPVPSFYMALAGRLLHRQTGIPYGIDYIDPWVRDLTNQRNVRAILSQWLARMLEPVAVKKAALITGVSEAYYYPVLERNKLLNRKPTPVKHIAFPYGFDPGDHAIKLDHLTYPWEKSGKKIWIYAGAFLPNSHFFMNAFFAAIRRLKEEKMPGIEDIELWFIGTGQYQAKSITAYAEDHHIREQVFEVRERYPYLQTLNFLSAADTVMVIGSTEKHYTASKTYQSVMSGKKVFSILHEESQAVDVFEECRADQFCVRYNEHDVHENMVQKIREKLVLTLQDNRWDPDLTSLMKYSARESALKLAGAIDNCLAES